MAEQRSADLPPGFGITVRASISTTVLAAPKRY
jgi:hypothetical protein